VRGTLFRYWKPAAWARVKIRSPFVTFARSQPLLDAGRKNTRGECRFSALVHSSPDRRNYAYNHGHWK